jgi:hypothetical protein
MDPLERQVSLVRMKRNDRIESEEIRRKIVHAPLTGELHRTAPTLKSPALFRHGAAALTVLRCRAEILETLQFFTMDSACASVQLPTRFADPLMHNAPFPNYFAAEPASPASF